eukprot:GEZU01020643.1.p1 GENE.GEZU01020643.1~~GEZU01020643.1.p1  ORF type:complete len:160 (-),score=31.17 GEZU01020643.1:98-577(-)
MSYEERWDFSSWASIRSPPINDEYSFVKIPFPWGDSIWGFSSDDGNLHGPVVAEDIAISDVRTPQLWLSVRQTSDYELEVFYQFFGQWLDNVHKISIPASEVKRVAGINNHHIVAAVLWSVFLIGGSVIAIIVAAVLIVRHRRAARAYINMQEEVYVKQ